MHIMLNDLWEAMLPIIAAIVTAAVTAVLNEARKLLAQHVSSGQMDALQQAALKALAYGFQQAPALIEKEGWNSLTVKNEVLGHSLQYMITRFPGVLKSVGIDPTHPLSEPMVTTILDRLFPSAATIAASSPATPPAPGNGATTVVNNNA